MTTTTAPSLRSKVDGALADLYNNHGGELETSPFGGISALAGFDARFARLVVLIDYWIAAGFLSMPNVRVIDGLHRTLRTGYTLDEIVGMVHDALADYHNGRPGCA